MSLDAVIELKVDEAALLSRIEKRASETVAGGGVVRHDDSPEVVRARLDAYRTQTAPVVAYYATKNALTSVDGMAPIATVSTAIDKVLGG